MNFDSSVVCECTPLLILGFESPFNVGLPLAKLIFRSPLLKLTFVSPFVTIGFKSPLVSLCLKSPLWVCWSSVWMMFWLRLKMSNGMRIGMPCRWRGGTGGSGVAEHGRGGNGITYVDRFEGDILSSIGLCWPLLWTMISAKNGFGDAIGELEWTTVWMTGKSLFTHSGSPLLAKGCW